MKEILPDAVVTYAADWSEYFGYHRDDGSGDVFFNLDPLWASPAIDAIGIDDYLPVTDYALKSARASDHELIVERSYRIPVD